MAVEATTHNPELWVVLATMIGPIVGAQRIILLSELGIMIKVNMPKVCHISCSLAGVGNRSRWRSQYKFVLEVRIHTGRLNIQRDVR